MIGIGTGGLIVGALGAGFFTKGKPVNTGLSRLYRIGGQRKTEVAFYVKVNEDGYSLEFDAPYGVSWAVPDAEAAEEDANDAASELADEIAEAAPFAEAEDAAGYADEAMTLRGYTPVDGWLDALRDDLKKEPIETETEEESA